MVTTVQIILIVIAALIFLAGLFVFIRSLKRRATDDITEVEYDKNGIPIIPRHERNLINEPDFDDTIAGETTITPSRTHLSAIIEDEAPIDQDLASSPVTTPQSGYQRHEIDDDDEQIATWQAQQQQADDDEFAQIASQALGDERSESAEHDAFSTLASATDHLMPVINTAEEPDFTDDSPVLDQHLLAAADQDQNSPLNHATDNINITLLPQQVSGEPPVVIRGQYLLELVDKFGLKYGAMNMFHRYEEKDGTGILWFSMMGITDEGIAPFDLYTMPHTVYSGLVLFLSLPHPKALQGFDSMMSIAGLMSRELGALVLDENNDVLTPEHKARLRTEVQEYRAR